MYILFFIIGWIVSIPVATFTITSIGTIFFFGIPFTRQLKKDNFLHNNSIIRNYFLSVIILSIIYIGALLLIKNFFPAILLGFVVGSVMVILFSLRSMGTNPNNVNDYLRVNKKYIRDIFWSQESN